MKQDALIFLSIIFVLFVSLLIIPVSAAQTATVSPGDDIAAVIAGIDDGGTIYFTAGTYNVNIVIDDPGKSFSLVGAGQGSTFLDGNGADSVIKILNSDPHTITVNGFTLQNGSYGTQNVGGGIHTNNSIIRVQNCTITNNTTINGGGMYIQYSAGEITNCSFFGNLADGGSGGAIYNWSSSPDITNCTFNSNEADSFAFGGAIYNHNSSSPTITDCTFTNNTTNGSGGAIANNIDSSPTIMSCTFTENEGDFAGAIGNRYGSESFISDCTFNGNIADGWGGAIYNLTHPDEDPDQPKIIGCTFYLNEVDGKGGAIANNNSSPEIEDCSFTENSAYDGGAIFNTDSSPIISGCTFLENMASYGAGIRSENMSDLTVSHCLFDSNAATGFGGAMYNYDDTSISVQNSFFSNNSAQYGAGIYNNDTYIVDVEKSFFNGNDANYGGAIYITQSYYMAATNCIFNANMADYGGAIDFGQHTMGAFKNCTFYGNIADDGGAIRYLTTRLFYVTNCILWNNGDEISDYFNNDSEVVTYSDVQDGWPGEGNINVDPLFVNAPFDLSLQSISPCIDAGTDTSDTNYTGIGSVTDDINGTPRPQRAGYDIGAYEYAGSSWSPVSIMPITRTQLANATDAWNELSAQLPDEPTEEITSLVEGIQAYMQNATGLTNPVYASGELARALALMDELSTIL